ncbi:hypothetical protein EV424DRAFT_1554763 [Suillus variegatus]|nr:hypothetical protein EV424DRAFT_1554763 [Suillus variegatus]
MTLDPIASTSTSRKMAIKGDLTMMSQDTSHNKQNTDIHNSTNNLITPNKWYIELQQGTLVLFAATMHGYVQKDSRQKGRKTWQLVTKSIKVIDRLNEIMEPRYKAVLPTTKKCGTTSSAALMDFKIKKKRKHPSLKTSNLKSSDT